MKEKELQQNTDQIIDRIDKLSKDDTEKVNGGVNAFICPAGMSMSLGNDVIIEEASSKPDPINYSTAGYSCKTNMRPKVKNNA